MFFLGQRRDPELYQHLLHFPYILSCLSEPHVLITAQAHVEATVEPEEVSWDDLSDDNYDPNDKLKTGVADTKALCLIDNMWIHIVLGIGSGVLILLSILLAAAIYYIYTRRAISERKGTSRTIRNNVDETSSKLSVIKLN